MEAIAALSLASNVIQVVDFSARIVSKGYKVYKSSDGVLVEDVDAEIITQDLSALNGKLQLSYDNVGSSAPLSEDDRSLMKLCEKSKGLADELLSRLDRVEVSGKHRKWKSARQALKSVTHRDELSQFLSRLNDYRSELTLHIIVSLRYELSYQDD